MSDWKPERSFGVLFDNKTKEEGDKKPDLTETINIDGNIRKIAMWYKEARTGAKYYSIKLEDEE